MELDKLHEIILKYKTGTSFVITMNTNQIIEAALDTCYETDNGLDENDDDYKEYYACVFKIIKIVTSSLGSKNLIENDNLIEISIQNPPREIKLMDGSIIWTKQKINSSGEDCR